MLKCVKLFKDILFFIVTQHYAVTMKSTPPSMTDIMEEWLPSTTDIMKEWLFSAKTNRYIHKILSASKSLEMDIDGSLYFHLKFPYKLVHFRMIKNYCDQHYEHDFYGERDNLITDTCEEYYYKGSVELIARDFSSQELVIQLKCKTSQLFEAFLKWDANLVEIISFLETYATD